MCDSCKKATWAYCSWKGSCETGNTADQCRHKPSHNICSSKHQIVSPWPLHPATGSLPPLGDTSKYLYLRGFTHSRSRANLLWPLHQVESSQTHTGCLWPLHRNTSPTSMVNGDTCPWPLHLDMVLSNKTELFWSQPDFKGCRCGH